MGDQRIETRPPLGGIDAGNGPPACGIGAEAINRLGRESHEAAVPDDAGGRGDGLRFGRQMLGLHCHEAPLPAAAHSVKVAAT
jgi:hypothetical protein